MTRRIALLFAVLILIAAPAVFAQEATPDPLKTDEPEGTPVPAGDLTAYEMEVLSVFIPVGAEVNSAWVDEAIGRVLRMTATVDDGVIRYVYYPPSAATADAALYYTLEGEMLQADLGLTLTTYEQLVLYGRDGWRIDGVNAVTGWLARGRIGRLPDEGILVTIATAPDERLLARRADAAAYGLAFSPHGTPNLPMEFPPVRMGAPELVLNTPVQGYLDTENIVDSWTYSGHAGERVSFAVVDLARAFVFDLRLDMAIRVINPDGTEFGYNDDQVGTDLFGAYDALLAEVILPADGIYTIQVEWVQGSGWYTLGVSGESPIPTDADPITAVGTITNVFTVERWTFEANTGDQLTITMTADPSSSLDPMLELITPDGRSLALNDDAADLTLELNAQIVDIVIPADGVYVIEAGRFEGIGSYTLQVDVR
mgnify:CR=1 FL=1